MNTTTRDVPSPYLPPSVAPSPQQLSSRSIAAFLAWMAGGAAVGVVVGTAQAWVRPMLHVDALDHYVDAMPAVGAGWVVFFFLATLLPNVLVHEAGHAIAGLSRGMQAVAVGIGPWRWERSLEGWRLRRTAMVRGISGFAILLPRGEHGRSRFDQCVYFAGGPAANLATLGVALAVLPWTTQAPLAGAFVIAVAVGAAVLAFVNLVPFRTAGWNSDGRNLVDLFRRSQDAENARRVRETVGLTMAGVRPRDWPVASLPELSTRADDVPSMADIGAASQVLSYAIDADDAVRARAAARQLVAGYAHMPEALRPHIALGMGAFAAGIERDRDLLAAWRPLCDGGLLVTDAVRAWLDAELAALSDRADAVHAAVARARTLRDRVPDEVSRRLLDERLDELEAHLGSSPRHDSWKPAHGRPGECLNKRRRD